jgi:hypothetical protein
MKTKMSGLAVLIATLAAGALGAAYATAAPTARELSFVIHNTGTEYLTKAGTTSVFPGQLNTGDQIFSRDTLAQGSRTIGFDNETCSVTFDNNDLCHSVAVFTGKGDVEATWLWVGRNTSQYGPTHFTGVIDGGTGSYQHATGQFDATVLPNGTLQITAKLG